MSSLQSRRRFLRRVVPGLGLGLAGLAAWSAYRLWPEQGFFHPCLGPLPTELADHALLRAAWAGLDPAQTWDAHAHLFAREAGHGELGGGGSGAAALVRRPLAALQQGFFENAACISAAAPGAADAAYVERLADLAAAFPPGFKLLLLALDAWHDEAGRAVAELTHVRVDNAWCAAIAARRPDRFEWAASIHPYRPDAVDAIERARAQGARAVKWIPAAQNIDPAAPRCAAVYAALARLDLPLICHAGAERAAPGDDSLGNPLRLRAALERGVRVVVAHCASMGSSRDLDRGEAGPWTDNFALFERLMDESASAGLLFGDLAAVTQSARAGPALARIVARGGVGGDWAGRLLNGSDYPLPAIMPLYSLGRLVELGLLDADAVAPLGALRRHNALLFDFVLKRTLRSDGKGLAASVFETRRFFAKG